MAKYRVTYSVKFQAEVEEDETGDWYLSDEIAGIDIPEGGEHNSQYIDNSYEILSVEDENGKEVKDKIFR